MFRRKNVHRKYRRIGGGNRSVFFYLLLFEHFNIWCLFVVSKYFIWSLQIKCNPNLWWTLLENTSNCSFEGRRERIRWMFLTKTWVKSRSPHTNIQTFAFPQSVDHLPSNHRLHCRSWWSFRLRKCLKTWCWDFVFIRRL